MKVFSRYLATLAMCGGCSPDLVVQEYLVDLSCNVGHTHRVCFYAPSSTACLQGPQTGSFKDL